MTRVRSRPTPPHADYFPMPAGPGGPGVWWSRLADDARQLARFRPVLWNMVAQELRVRYQRSVLGFLWSLLNPILMMTTMTVVFSSRHTWVARMFHPMFTPRSFIAQEAIRSS